MAVFISLSFFFLFLELKVIYSVNSFKTPYIFKEHIHYSRHCSKFRGSSGVHDYKVLLSCNLLSGRE